MQAQTKRSAEAPLSSEKYTLQSVLSCLQAEGAEEMNCRMAEGREDSGSVCPVYGCDCSLLNKVLFTVSRVVPEKASSPEKVCKSLENSVWITNNVYNRP